MTEVCFWRTKLNYKRSVLDCQCVLNMSWCIFRISKYNTVLFDGHYVYRSLSLSLSLWEKSFFRVWPLPGSLLIHLKHICTNHHNYLHISRRNNPVMHRTIKRQMFHKKPSKFHRCLRTGPPPHSPDIKPRAYPDYFHKLSFYNIFVI